jgi:hypothetical protein
MLGNPCPNKQESNMLVDDTKAHSQVVEEDLKGQLPSSFTQF